MKVFPFVYTSALAGLVCCPLSATAVQISDHWSIGGAVRARFDLDPDRDIGKAGLDTVMANVAFDDDTWMGAAQYRWYGRSYPFQYLPLGGLRFVEHAWVGRHLEGDQQIKVGLTKVPFGLQPLFSSTFYETLGNVVGLEDVSQVGVSWQRSRGDWDLQAGVYARPAWPGHGSSNGSTYAIVVTPADPGVAHGSRNTERGLLALRATHALHGTEGGVGEVGVSLLHSVLHNLDTGLDGQRNVFAAHYQYQQGPWGMRVLLARQLMDPRNPDGSQTVTFGGYDGTFNVAGRGTLGSADLSYALPGAWLGGWISAIKPYVNYSRYEKSAPGFLPTQRFIAGTSFNVKKVYVALEMLQGRNDPYLGGSSYTQSLAAGGTDHWKRQLYMNIGYYF